MTGRNNQPDKDGVKSNPSRLEQFADTSALTAEEASETASMACRDTEPFAGEEDSSD
jgi:hypothetical protein